MEKKDLTKSEAVTESDEVKFEELFDYEESFDAAKATYKGKQRDCLRYTVAFDATSSMSPYWNMALTAVEQAVNKIRDYKLSKPAEINIVAYRDECDGPVMRVEESGFTDDLDKLKNFIYNVQCHGGGDFPENINLALQKTLKTESNMLILIGDAPPHHFGDKNSDFEGREDAIALGQERCPVYALYINTSEEPDHEGRADRMTRQSFEAIADITGGKAYKLGAAGDIPDIITTLLSHDKALIKSAMNYIPYMPTTETGKAIAEDAK